MNFPEAELGTLPIMGTVRLLDVRYTIEDDGSGGSMPVYLHTDENGSPEPYGDELVECFTVAQAARAIIEHGCSEDAGHWYSDPDGSHTVDYGTGEQSEHSAHPKGFTDAQLDAIGAIVRASA